MVALFRCALDAISRIWHLKHMYQEIKTRIAQKCRELGREEPKLVAVSKMQPLENVESVLTQGHRVFGENRVQEAQGKWPAFRDRFSEVELHLLGPLQSNKVNAALELFNCIHSLDRKKLAVKLAQSAQEQGRCPELFIQVNTGNEPQKAGVSPVQLDDFWREIKVLELPVIGLMCIPPFDQDPRPHFRLLRELSEKLELPSLSMGMSNDFEIAIEEGATHIRVGSAIFGARDY